MNPNWKYEARSVKLEWKSEQERSWWTKKMQDDTQTYFDIWWIFHQENQQMNSCVHYLFQNRSMKRILKEDVRVSLTGISFLVMCWKNEGSSADLNDASCNSFMLGHEIIYEYDQSESLVQFRNSHFFRITKSSYTLLLLYVDDIKKAAVWARNKSLSLH